MLSKNKIKFIQSLHLKKNRDSLNLFIAEGAKIISDLLLAGCKANTIVATQDWINSHKNTNSSIIEAEIDEIKKISLLKTPSSVLGVFEIINDTFIHSSINHGITIVLDGIQDPGNMGTIIRLADWFGINRIICSLDTVDCYNPKVVQATMGAIARIQINYMPLPTFLEQAKDITTVYGTFMDGENIYSQSLNPNSLIVFGNEGQGISNEVANLITHRLTIPSFATTNTSSESLNVSVAAAIVCSEFKRMQL